MIASLSRRGRVLIAPLKIWFIKAEKPSFPRLLIRFEQAAVLSTVHEAVPIDGHNWWQSDDGKTIRGTSFSCGSISDLLRFSFREVSTFERWKRFLLKRKLTLENRESLRRFMWSVNVDDDCQSLLLMKEFKPKLDLPSHPMLWNTGRLPACLSLAQHQ